MEHAQRSFLTPSSSGTDNSALRTKGNSKPKYKTLLDEEENFLGYDPSELVVSHFI